MGAGTRTGEDAHEAWVAGKSTRRRRLWVDGRLQGILLRRDLVFALILLTSFIATLLAPLVAALLTQGAGHLELEAAVAFLHLNGAILPASLIALTVIVTCSIFTSHRLAGPLARLRRHLKLVQLGEAPGPFRIRVGDHLQADIDQLNATIAELEARAEGNTALAAAVRKVIAELPAEDPCRARLEAALIVPYAKAVPDPGSGS